jgi:uncharacterized membrane protein
MQAKAAITIDRPRDEVERRWRAAEPLAEVAEGEVTFDEAPGGRGTEIRVDLERQGVIARLKGAPALAKVKDELRHFKQLLETGEVPRSDATPEGESAKRKLKQRPAQPMSADEREHVGV